MRNLFLIWLLIIHFGTVNLYGSCLDSLKFKELEDKAVALFEINNDSAELLLKNLEQLCIQCNYEKGLAKCYGQFGVLYKNIGNFPLSLEKFNEAIELYKKLKNEKSVAILHLSLGAVYTHIGDYSTALENIHKTLDFFENSDNSFIKAGAYLTISAIYINNQEYDIADEYIDKAISEYKKIDNTWGICGALLNRGLMFYEQNKYIECIKALKELIVLAEEVNSTFYIPDAYVYIGSSYLNLDNLNNAEEYLLKVLKCNDVNSQVLLEAYIYLGELYYKKGEINKAIDFTQKVISDSKSLNLQGNLQKAYNILAKYYSESGRFKEAYSLKQLSYDLRDSLYNEEKSLQMKKLETIYQVGKKQQKIESLEKENRIKELELQKSHITYVLIIIILVVMTLGIILFIRNGKLKMQHKNIRLEQQLLRVQLNPHFIFNAISAIQHYILKNNPLEAGSYLSNFAKLMRSVLLNSRNELVSLETEIQTLENYLTLQQLRLDGNLKFSLNEKLSFENNEILLPPMLLQPFIENAIEHGILKKIDQSGLIEINFLTRDELLIIEIIDDGIGREAARSINNIKHKSLATEITLNRIKNMKSSYRKNVSLNITDLENYEGKPKGTKVIFELPLIFS